jgi:hypothetical protein
VRCGWRYRDKPKNETWAVLGALGEGTDLVPNKRFYYPSSGGVLPYPDQSLRDTITLDRDIVQGWIDNPANNFGRGSLMFMISG